MAPSPSPLHRLRHLLDALGSGAVHNKYEFAGVDRLPLTSGRDIITLRFEESHGWTRGSTEAALVALLRNHASSLHQVLEAANRQFELHLGCPLCSGGDFHASDCPLGILTGRSEPSLESPAAVLEAFS